MHPTFVCDNKCVGSPPTLAFFAYLFAYFELILWVCRWHVAGTSKTHVGMWYVAGMSHGHPTMAPNGDPNVGQKLTV